MTTIKDGEQINFQEKVLQKIFFRYLSPHTRNKVATGQKNDVIYETLRHFFMRTINRLGLPFTISHSPSGISLSFHLSYFIVCFSLSIPSSISISQCLSLSLFHNSQDHTIDECRRRRPISPLPAHIRSSITRVYPKLKNKLAGPVLNPRPAGLESITQPTELSLTFTQVQTLTEILSLKKITI